MMRHRNPNRLADRIVFWTCLVVGLFWFGYETGAYAERLQKAAACATVPAPQKSLYDVSKRQQKRWIKYYLARGA